MPEVLAIQTTNNQIRLGEMEHFPNNEMPKNTMRFVIMEMREEVFVAFMDMVKDDPQRFAKSIFNLINDVGGIHMG